MPADARRAATLLVALTALVWVSALSGTFQFDDWNVIVDNPLVRSWAAWWSGMPGIRPLLKLTYAACWTAGPGPAVFLAFNVGVHVANAWLVFALVRVLAPRLDLPAGAWTPSVAALVFALHPAQTEAVTYISGRSSSLAATCMLLSLLATLHADAAPRRFAWDLLAGLAFLAAFAVKETAWALPGLALLCRAWHEAGPPPRRRAWFWPHVVVLALGAALVVAIPAYWRLLGASLDTRSLGDNLLTQVDGVFHLLAGPLWGVALSIDPDLPVRDAWAPDLVAKAGVLLALLAVAAWQWRRRPWLAFGIAWWCIALLPTNSVLPRLDVVNDRQLYLALVGPAVIAARLLADLAGAPRLVMTAAVLALAAGGTVLRNADYRSEVALWEATALRSPGKARVWNNLGFAYEQAGRKDDAIRAYDRALAIDPEFWKARMNRGAVR